MAVIGDGAMTAGMAFEALNHAGDRQARLLVILNDNEMSISENVGALSKYVNRVLSGKMYNQLKDGGKKVLQHMPHIWEFARKTKSHLKGMLIPGTLFEELGFNYIGPIDGHDLPTLITTLNNIKQLEGPQFLHVITQKGKGYAPAERDPIAYHAVAPGFLKPKDKEASTSTPKKSYSQVFGTWACHTAANEPKLVVLTPAMREGSGLVDYAKQYPERFIDVGIAEQHSVTCAAGLAAAGVQPVVAIYSTFLQRAYDQLVHDVALQKLPVVFAVDRAGLVGGDGSTHQGAFDISFLQCIPNLTIMAASNEQELCDMLHLGLSLKSPAVVRYPRGTGPGQPITHPAGRAHCVTLGQAQVAHSGRQVAILAWGPMVHTAIEVGKILNATVVNMRFIKPLDTELILDLAKRHQLLVTLEDNVVLGGVGSRVAQILAKEPEVCRLLNLGLPDEFIEHGVPSALYAQLGLDAEGVLKSIRRALFSNYSCKEAEELVQSAGQ